MYSLRRHPLDVGELKMQGPLDMYKVQTTIYDVSWQPTLMTIPPCPAILIDRKHWGQMWPELISNDFRCFRFNICVICAAACACEFADILGDNRQTSELIV